MHAHLRILHFNPCSWARWNFHSRYYTIFGLCLWLSILNESAKLILMWWLHQSRGSNLPARSLEDAHRRTGSLRYCRGPGLGATNWRTSLHGATGYYRGGSSAHRGRVVCVYVSVCVCTMFHNWKKYPYCHGFIFIDDSGKQNIISGQQSVFIESPPSQQTALYIFLKK